MESRLLQWSADDLFLHSCGLDGAVYTWSVKELKRIREAMQKGCQYSCVTAVGDEKDGRIFAVGDDCKIKEYVDPLTISKELDTGVEITHVVLSSNQRHLFAATVAGQLRMYKYPFTGEFQELQAHVKPISRMCISTDDMYIFTVSEDGTLAVHTIRCVCVIPCHPLSRRGRLDSRRVHGLEFRIWAIAAGWHAWLPPGGYQAGERATRWGATSCRKAAPLSYRLDGCCGVRAQGQGGAQGGEGEGQHGAVG